SLNLASFSVSFNLPNSSPFFLTRPAFTAVSNLARLKLNFLSSVSSKNCLSPSSISLRFSRIIFIGFPSALLWVVCAALPQVRPARHAFGRFLSKPEILFFPAFFIRLAAGSASPRSAPRPTRRAALSPLRSDQVPRHHRNRPAGSPASSP